MIYGIIKLKVVKDVNYVDVLGKIRTDVNPEESKARAVRMRPTKREDLLLKIKGS